LQAAPAVARNRALCFGRPRATARFTFARQGATAAGMWPALGAFSGLLVGSFVATLVLRWPRDLPMSGRSRCDGCSAQLNPHELVPLLSFAIQRGRCRRCGGAIDPAHPLIEAACAAVGALALFALPGWHGFAGALLGWFLVALIALDVAHFWLPDRLTLPLMAFGLALGPAPPGERFLAAAIAGGSFLFLAVAYRALRGRDGLGLGDAKLAAALAAWLSLDKLPPLLLTAALLGLGLAAVGAVRGKRLGPDTRIPFGACLAAAAFPLWLWMVAKG
jgi:leader peptidase (prepilin peptidase) / N-methyltransferase